MLFYRLFLPAKIADAAKSNHTTDRAYPEQNSPIKYKSCRLRIFFPPGYNGANPYPRKGIPAHGPTSPGGFRCALAPAACLAADGILRLCSFWNEHLHRPGMGRQRLRRRQNGKTQAYDWEGYYQIIRRAQPNAVISVCGPDVRWCGNEAGACRPSEWSVVPAALRSAERTAAHSQQADDAEFSRRVTSTDEDLGSRAESVAGLCAGRGRRSGRGSGVGAGSALPAFGGFILRLRGGRGGGGIGTGRGVRLASSFFAVFF